MADYSEKKYNKTLKNPTIEGNEGLTLPTGTTGQRPAVPVLGQVRYNSTTGLAEIYSAAGYVLVDAPPSISTFSGLINENTNTIVTITGTNFQNGTTISISGAATTNIPRVLSTTFISSTTLTANTAAATTSYTSGQLFNVIATNPSGLANTLSSAGTIDGDPVWSTSSGSLGTFYLGDSVSTTVEATDVNADTITYSVSSGSLPTGLSLNSSTGVISGTLGGSATTTTFTLRATSTVASTVSTADRSFSIVSEAVATGGTITDITVSSVNYKLHAFTSGTTNFVLNANKAIDVLIVAGGGGGGRALGDNDTGKGGGGAGQVLVRSGYSPGAGTYSMVVGAGGPGLTNGSGSSPSPPTAAGNSTGFGVTANGGGYGGASDNHYAPSSGGSGGGSGARNGTNNGAASNKSTPASWTSYGNSGGNSHGNNSGGGGGGGAGGAGDTAADNANGGSTANGGIGIDLTTTFGTSYGSPGGYFAGGGGGGSYSTGSVPGQSNDGVGGYYGGGGRGTAARERSNGNGFNVTNNDATANTGGGGGGSSEDANLSANQGSRSGAGAAGIILIRYTA